MLTKSDISDMPLSDQRQAWDAYHEEVFMTQTYYNPEVKPKPEWRHIHEDRCFDFSDLDDTDWGIQAGSVVKVSDDETHLTFEKICNDPYETDFVNIDIDMSDSLLEFLIQRAACYLENKVRPCSWDIWQQHSCEIENVKDLQTLFGECLVNDDIVDVIIAGCEDAIGSGVEPYYQP